MNETLSAPERAVQFFQEGYNCSQAVFAAFAGEMGLPLSDALRLSAALGGGLCRMRETCGAVEAAGMVLGMCFGGDQPGEEQKMKMYALGQAFFAPFKEKYGSYNCAELLHLLKDAPLSPVPTPRNAEFYQIRPCARFVYTLADMLDRALKDRGAASTQE